MQRVTSVAFTQGCSESLATRPAFIHIFSLLLLTDGVTADWLGCTGTITVKTDIEVMSISGLPDAQHVFDELVQVTAARPRMVSKVDHEHKVASSPRHEQQPAASVVNRGAC